MLSLSPSCLMLLLSFPLPLSPSHPPSPLSASLSEPLFYTLPFFSFHSLLQVSFLHLNILVKFLEILSDWPTFLHHTSRAATQSPLPTMSLEQVHQFSISSASSPYLPHSPSLLDSVASALPSALIKSLLFLVPWMLSVC